MNQLVSIIIPVFNRVSLVARAIECAINQTYLNIEIIIGDNCSSDGSWKLIQEYSKKDKRIIIFQNDENIGPVRNWSECLKRSNGEFIKFIFSDDWISNDWIENAIIPLKNKKIGFTFSSADIHINNKSKTHYKWNNNNKIYSSNYYIFLNFFGGNAPVSPGCALFRRKDIQQNLLLDIENPLNINYSKHGGGIDLLLFLNIAKKYENIAFINSSKVHFLGSSDSITFNQDLKEAYTFAKIRFINKHKTFSLFYWMKLKKEKNSLVRFLIIQLTIKDLQLLYYFCKLRRQKIFDTEV